MRDFLHLKLKKLRRSIKSMKKRINDIKYICLPFGRKVYFVDLPDYDNLGDSAIALAQIKFLEQCGFSKERIKTFTYSEFNDNVNYLNKHINNKHLICGIGGGNMGNQWYSLELFRYKYISMFPKNPIVIFPQTVYFTKDDDGKKAIDKSCVNYKNHSNLTLVARETTSFKIIDDLYEKPLKLLTPDIVLSTSICDYQVEKRERNTVLLVFRSDVEKFMTDDNRDAIVSLLETWSINYKTTDMYANCNVNNSNRYDCVRRKMQEFADSKLVITDRLHGMVFAAITETPCIVFSNYNHKVKGTYEWIKHLDYVKYVESVEEALEYIPELLKMENCKFDNTPFINEFDKLKEVIKRYAD